MPDLDPTTLLMILATFIVAGIVKGVTGMGLPTVAMGVLGLFMPPVIAAGLLSCPPSSQISGNCWLGLIFGPS